MDKLVTIATFDFPVEAEAAKLFLENDGIRAFLADNNLVGMNWFLSNAVGGAKLQVAARDADQASEILERHKASNAKTQETVVQEDIHFACQECGKSISFAGERRGHVEECPHCGEYVDVPYESEESHQSEAGTTASHTNEKNIIQPSLLNSGQRTSVQLWIEVIAVLCLAYVPYMVFAVYGLYEPWSTTLSFVGNMLNEIVSSLQVMIPLLVIIWLSNDQWSMFGIVRPKWLIDVAIGGLVFICGMMAYLIAYYSFTPSILESSGSVYSATAPIPKGIFAHLLCLVFCVLSGFAQELVMRGYLLARLERLLRSTTAAVLVTTALFASYHIYQGIPAVVACAALGFVYAVSFCMTRRIWPLCLAHAFHIWIISMLA